MDHLNSSPLYHCPAHLSWGKTNVQEAMIPMQTRCLTLKHKLSKMGLHGVARYCTSLTALPFPTFLPLKYLPRLRMPTCQNQIAAETCSSSLDLPYADDLTHNKWGRTRLEVKASQNHGICKSE